MSLPADQDLDKQTELLHRIRGRLADQLTALEHDEAAIKQAIQEITREPIGRPRNEFDRLQILKACIENVLESKEIQDNNITNRQFLTKADIQ